MTLLPRKTIDDIRGSKEPHFNRHIHFKNMDGQMKYGTVIKIENHGPLGFMIQYKDRFRNTEEWEYSDEFPVME